MIKVGFPGGSVGKHPPVNAGDSDSFPGLGRAPGKGNGNPLQYACLENPMDRGAWWAIVHSVPKSQAQLSDKTTTTTPAILKYLPHDNPRHSLTCKPLHISQS